MVCPLSFGIGTQTWKDADRTRYRLTGNLLVVPPDDLLNPGCRSVLLAAHQKDHERAEGDHSDHSDH